jgi:hypothetical protein
MSHIMSGPTCGMRLAGKHSKREVQWLEDARPALQAAVSDVVETS